MTWQLHSSYYPWYSSSFCSHKFNLTPLLSSIFSQESFHFTILGKIFTAVKPKIFSKLTREKRENSHLIFNFSLEIYSTDWCLILQFLLNNCYQDNLVPVQQNVGNYSVKGPMIYLSLCFRSSNAQIKYT